jgi:hypothetical protein
MALGENPIFMQDKISTYSYLRYLMLTICARVLNPLPADIQKGTKLLRNKCVNFVPRITANLSFNDLIFTLTQIVRKNID